MTRNFKIFKNIIGVLIILICVYFIINLYLPTDKRKYEKSNSDLLLLTNYLINDPVYNIGTGKNRTYLKLVLNGYPGITFENENEYLQATSLQAVLKDIKYNDTISIKVLKSKFKKFYLEKDSLSTFESIINYPSNRLEFYSLSYKGKEYVNNLFATAESYNDERFTGRLVMCIIFIGIGIYTLMAKK